MKLLALILLPLAALAQPLPPQSAPSFGPYVPTLYERTLEWDASPDTRANLFYRVFHNGSFIGSTNALRFPVQLVAGTNICVVTSAINVGTNMLESEPSSPLRYSIGEVREVSVWLEAGPTMTGPFTKTNAFTVQNPTGNLFARAGVSSTNKVVEGVVQ